MSTIRFHLRGSRALINGSLAVQNDGSRAGIGGEGVATSGGTPAYSYVEVARFQQPRIFSAFGLVTRSGVLAYSS